MGEQRLLPLALWTVLMTLDSAKRPANSAIAGPYGHPFHPLLVTVPIGAWISSLIFDIGSHVIDNDPSFLTRGSEWLIVIGIIGAVVAALAGLTDLMVVPRGTRAFTTALTHMALNTIVLIAFIVNFLWRHGSSSDDLRVSTGEIVLSAVSLAVLAVSGSLGAKLAFKFGVRVADERTQLTGFSDEPARTDAGARRA